MAKSEKPDDFGPPRIEQKETPIEHSRESGRLRGAEPFDGVVHGASEQDPMDYRTPRGHRRYDWGAVAQGGRNGDRRSDYIPAHPHSIRAVKAMGMADKVLWWGMWGLRLAVIATLISIVYGLTEG